MTLEEIERAAILAELERQNGHRNNTAKALGISIRSLRARLARYFYQGFEIPKGAEPFGR